MLGNRWRTELDKKLSELTQLRELINDCIGCGCLSLQRCDLINPHDKLGDEKGAGPHFKDD